MTIHSYARWIIRGEIAVIGCIAIICAVYATTYCGARVSLNCQCFGGHPDNDVAVCCTNNVAGDECYVYCLDDPNTGFGGCVQIADSNVPCNYPIDLGLVSMTEWDGKCTGKPGAGTNKCAKVFKIGVNQYFLCHACSQSDPFGSCTEVLQSTRPPLGKDGVIRSESFGAKSKR